MRLRAIAAITAAWLVVCGMLAMRHEAHVAHVADGAGGYAHAPALTGTHVDGGSDFHGERDANCDTEHCSLLTAFHQAASAATSTPRLTALALALRTVDVASASRAIVTARVYRLAPKTSPPRAC